MNGYILNLVTCFDNRDFTKHYDAKVRLQGDQPQQKQDGYALFANVKIAQAFHPLLSSFEVILRNQLHYALACHFSDGIWIINQKSGFMVASSLTYTNKRTKKKLPMTIS